MDLNMRLELDEPNAERAKHFFQDYTLEGMAGDTDSKFFLGTDNPRVCRFCLKDTSQTSFSMEAHVIPQFMGNKNLVSYFECDKCNGLFSKYEDSFANFFGISRTFAQIKGQTNKVPKFKDKKTGLEVSVGSEAVQITIMEDKEVIRIDEENKSFEVLTERPGYIPIHIPKMMIKIGLSIIQEKDLMDYEIARKFIIQSDKDVDFENHSSLRIFGYFIPGLPIFDKPFVQVYKRKIEGVDFFSRHIVMFYANYCFQMLMPFGKCDNHLNGKKVSVHLFPLLIDNTYFEKYGKYQQLNMNLTSSIKKKGEEHKITFGYESMDKTV